MFCLQRIRVGSMGVSKPPVFNTVPTNNFWGWLTFVFNSKYSQTNVERVSKSRIEQVGPDRACAEWLMRNGALVRWKGQTQFVSHYDRLPKDEDTGKYRLQEVDATDSSISHHGFPHFRQCECVEKIKFEDCQYLEDSALKELKIVRSSLHQLRITKCHQVTAKGVLSLDELSNLKELYLSDLEGVEKMDSCVLELKKKLPLCNVISGKGIV